MVMNYEIYDTYLHMSNHYKLINSAKSVVNTSPPKSYLLQHKNHTSTISSRFFTPSLLSKNELIASRPNSHSDLQRRKIKVHNCLSNEFTTKKRSASVPRIRSKRNLSTCSQSELKSGSSTVVKLCNSSRSEIKLSPVSDKDNDIERISPDCESVNKIELETPNNESIIFKTPMPTPRSFNKPIIPDYEYLQFSLRITEDIIRNDLYNQNEMQRVFNSHLEANRGRLEMSKMLRQIENLCKELNITKMDSLQSSESDSVLNILTKNQYEIPSKEVNHLNGNEVENITEILDSENTKNSSLNSPTELNQFLLNENLPLELVNNVQNIVDTEIPQLNASESNTENKFDLISETQNLKSFNLSYNDKASTNIEDEEKNISAGKVTSKNPEKEPSITSNDTNNHLVILLEDSGANFPVTIITGNESVPGISKDNYPEKINENEPEKELINTNNDTQLEVAGNHNIHLLLEELEVIEDEKIHIKKNENTQTPFSNEIAQFMQNLCISNDKDVPVQINPGKYVSHNTEDTINDPIENNTNNFEQQTSKTTEYTIQQTNKRKDSFVTTVNNMILNQINYLFEPALIVEENIPDKVNDYFKYEAKTTDDKYICNKYKKHYYSPRSSYNSSVKLTHSSKTSEISFSDGEIPFDPKKNILSRPRSGITNTSRRPEPNILKQLKKYECKEKYNTNNSINEYQLNKYEMYHYRLNDTRKKISSDRRRLSVQDSLLSDGEIKTPSSESDDTSYMDNIN